VVAAGIFRSAVPVVVVEDSDRERARDLRRPLRLRYDCVTRVVSSTRRRKRSCAIVPGLCFFLAKSSKAIELPASEWKKGSFALLDLKKQSDAAKQ